MPSSAINTHLQHLTHHRYLSLVPRGNSAIGLALSILPKNSTLLIPEEGGWLSYKSIPPKLGLSVEEVKCNDSRINVQNLREKLLTPRYAAFLYQNPGGYFAQQPIREIYELCRKNNCLVILDVSGAIGTELCNGNHADILVCSFGKWKLVDAGIGGFISAKEKKVGDRLAKDITLPGEQVALAKIQQKLEQLPLRIQYLTELRAKVMEELEQEKIEIVQRNDAGFVVVARFAGENEKQKIMNYCRRNDLEYTECPRYIRLNRPAISIEVKRKVCSTGVTSVILQLREAGRAPPRFSYDSFECGTSPELCDRRRAKSRKSADFREGHPPPQTNVKSYCSAR